MKAGTRELLRQGAGFCGSPAHLPISTKGLGPSWEQQKHPYITL